MDVTLADEDTNSIPSDEANRDLICNRSKWRHLVAEFAANAYGATWRTNFGCQKWNMFLFPSPKLCSLKTLLPVLLPNKADQSLFGEPFEFPVWCRWLDWLTLYFIFPTQNSVLEMLDNTGLHMTGRTNSNWLTLDVRVSNLQHLISIWWIYHLYLRHLSFLRLSEFIDNPLLCQMASPVCRWKQRNTINSG